MGSLQAGGWESKPGQGEESLLQILCFSEPQVDILTLLLMLTLIMIDVDNATIGSLFMGPIGSCKMGKMCKIVKQFVRFATYWFLVPNFMCPPLAQ